MMSANPNRPRQHRMILGAVDPPAAIIRHDVSEAKPAQMKAAGATTSHHWGTHRRMSGAVDSAPGGYCYT